MYEILSKANAVIYREIHLHNVIPEFVEFTNDLKVIYEEVKSVKSGKNASHIRELEKMDSGKS